MPDGEFSAGFFDDIAPDVLGVLKKGRFFEFLDDVFCPTVSAGQPAKCGHSFDYSVRILSNLGMDADEVADVLGVLQSRGGCCDCEVLYNLAEESRLKAQYWKARALEFEARRREPPES